MIPIFLSSDNNYAPYLTVAIKSICENTKSDIDFYILDCGIEDKSKTIITNLVSEYSGNTIEFINPAEQNIFSECHARNHVSKAAYARLLIPNLKPKIDKAIYLDVDIIVNLDIAELFNLNLNDYIIGASYSNCDEYHNYDIQTKNILGIDMKHNYFNSGILIIDCKKWRENNITQKLKDIYDEYKEKMIHHDQDLLNILFANNKYYNLDTKYNYIIQYQPIKNSNIIYHYEGPIKPWHYSPNLHTNIINYIDIWWSYAKKTDCFDIIKEKCICKDPNALRIAKVIKAHQMLMKQKINFSKDKECQKYQ